MKRIAKAESKLGTTAKFRYEGNTLSGVISKVDKVNDLVRMSVSFRVGPGFSVWVKVKEIDLR